MRRSGFGSNAAGAFPTRAGQTHLNMTHRIEGTFVHGGVIPAKAGIQCLKYLYVYRLECKHAAFSQSTILPGVYGCKGNWIPAFAGMTEKDRGMTEKDRGMTEKDRGMTEKDQVRVNRMNPQFWLYTTSNLLRCSRKAVMELPPENMGHDGCWKMRCVCPALRERVLAGRPCFVYNERPVPHTSRRTPRAAATARPSAEPAFTGEHA